MTSPAIHLHRVSKTFPGNAAKALDAVSLTVLPGEMVALIGASGSGKSTLMRHLAGLACADRESGAIRINGGIVQEGGRLARDIRARRTQIGLVFQQFNLVGRLPVMTNVLAGALGRVPFWRSLLRWFTQAERQEAAEALARVGILSHATRRASTLSGGQQQRAAIARTLMQKARTILADEPIASLDPESARRVMETLATVNRDDGITVVVSLHQVDFARRFCPRTIALKNGAVVFDGPSVALTAERLSDLYGADSELFAPAAMPSPSRVPAARDRLALGLRVEAEA